MKNELKKTVKERLMEKALLLLQNRPSSPDPESTNEKALNRIHELELYQVELELQGEELRLTQEKTQLLSDKYIALFDFAPLGYFELSENGEILELNLTGAELLGSYRSSLKQSRFDFFVADSTKPTFNLFLKDIFHKRTKENCELILIPKNSEPIYGLLSGIVIQNTNHCIVNVVDITQHKIEEKTLFDINKELAFQNQEKEKRAAELIISNNKTLKFSSEIEAQKIELEMQYKALQQSNEQFQALVEWTPLATLVHRDMKIIYVNPAAIKLFGAISAQDILGTPVMRWHHPDYHPIVRERIRKANEDGLAAPLIESKYLKLDGTVMDLEVHAIPITYNGLPSILAIFHNVTETRRMQHQLEDRLNEIGIYYYLSQLSARTDLSLETMYRKLVDYLPRGWYYPEITCARIVVDGVEFRTENFKDSPWRQSAPLMMHESVIGQIEISYLAEKPTEDEGPFLKEERELLDGVAAQLKQIIERKKGEEERARQSALINSLLDSVPDIIFFKDIEGVLLGCNPSYEKLVGKSRNEIIGKTDYELFGKTIADTFRQQDREMLLNKQPLHNEVWLNHANGNKILYDTFKTPYWSGDGNLLGILGISRDITERKRAEEDIHKQREILQRVFDHIPVMISYYNEAGKFEMMNREMVEKLGWDFEDWENESILAKMYPDPEAFKVVFDFMVNKPAGWLDFKTTTKYGTEIFTSWTNITLPNGVSIGIGQDITERKRTEEELKLISARLALATRNGGVGVWDYDIVNNTLLWDEQMYALYGIREGDFSGIYQAWQARLHPDDAERGDREVQMAILGEMEFDAEFRVVWPNGTIRTIKAIATVQRDNSGKAVRIIGTNWDISEQKRTEIEIKLQNEELQKINAGKDKFFSIIAHDLRGPIGSIKAMTEVLTDESYELTEAERKEATENLSTTASHTFTLLENLLEWTQMDRGLTKFEPEKLDLLNVVDECLTVSADTAKGKVIELIAQIPDEPQVFADKNMLKTVIRNFISNALKFTPEGGKVSISTKSLADDMTVVSVQDTGIGMTREMMDNLFSIGANTKRPGTNNEKSTGLGLLLCKEFVEKLGGKITVESEPDKGTVFSFTVPSAKSKQKKYIPEEVIKDGDALRRMDKLKILIAEDDDISAQLISFMVKELSEKFFFAKTGSQTVEICRNNPDINLVLMDIAMPVFDGYEATRQIRQFNQEALIIAQTTFVNYGDKEKALTAGCNSYIAKPFSKEALIELIKKHIK